MSLIKSIKNKIGAWVAQSPWLFFILCSLSPRYNKLLIKPDTDLVIEGFPRSGNTFSVVAFESVNSGIKIAHHLHATPQIFLAVKWGVPACVIIRQPIDAVKSLLVREQGLLPAAVLKGYVEFYSDIIGVKDHILIATFDEVATDFGKVIERINKKFNKQYLSFEHTPERVGKVFKKIKEINERIDAGSDTTIAMPNAKKEAFKKKVVFTDSDLLLLDKANEIYNLCCKSRG